MLAYYNEIDKYAAQWLRNLIAAGHIAPGNVDERSIEDVRPDELMGYTQCHFFAGVGVWSYALRQAGWPDSRPIWTGSCPCQPFSTAGQGAGFDDERHLWPAFFHLIEQCRPATVAGEQVAGADADPWIDLVCADMERLGYTFGAAPFPSAGVGAPHIRDRLYWVGHALGAGPQGQQRPGNMELHGAAKPLRPAWTTGASGGLADTKRQRHDRGGAEDAARAAISGRTDAAGHTPSALGLADAGAAGLREQCENDDRDAEMAERSQAGDSTHDARRREAFRVADAARGGLGEFGGEVDPRDVRHVDSGGDSFGARPGPVNGFWRDADWLACRDGKWRPVEPGTFPLAHGAAARVGRLRAYGNAINAEAARVFIECVMEAAT